MKTKALVLTFAVCAGALAAQQQGTAPTPSQELAPIVAVEEQERDLAKAERLYKEAIEGGKLSAEAKHQAMLRLAELLMKLGRRDEAMQWMAKAAESPFADVALDDVTSSAPQDREREEALRTKARELVQKVLAQSVFPYPSASGIFDEELRRQIEWLGESAVPEIGAALAAAKPTLAKAALGDLSPSTTRIEALRGLAGVLWRLGSPAARAQLEDAYRDGSDAFRALLVAQAARHAPALRELVVKWLNEDSSEAVFWQMARSGIELLGSDIGQPGWTEGRRLWFDLPPEVLLGAVERRSPALQARVLRSLGPAGTPCVPYSGAVASRACAMVRDLSKGTDPEVVRTALAALANPCLQATPQGFECLVEHLGRLGDDVHLNWAGLPREWTPVGNQNILTMEAAKRLWPKLAAAAIQGVSRGAKSWVRQAIFSFQLAIDGAVLDDVLALQARGEGGYLRCLSGRLDVQQAMRLARAFAGMDEASFEDGVAGLSGNDLPPEALPLLVGKTEQAVRLQKVGMLASLVARTGNPEAVPWLLAQAKVEERVRGALGLHLLQLGRRTQAEPVRVALRELAEQAEGSAVPELFLALLSMHDTATLARLADASFGHVRCIHPYETAEESPAISPLAYVLMDQPDPPHGFTEAELLAFAELSAAWRTTEWVADLDPERVATPILKVLAERSTLSVGNVPTSPTSSSSSSWHEAMAKRIAREQDQDGPLHAWLRGVLGKEGPGLQVVEHLVERDRVALRPHLERMLAGDDARLAMFAFEVLRKMTPPLDYDALTHSKHASIVERAANLGMNEWSLPVATVLRLLPTYSDPDEIAFYCGSKLAVEAVPALLQLLQHEDDGVRQAAGDALARIRAAHEQKAYWDRITKGLDASPSSAAEKLLLQAKPGAPRAQRLLAIPSLGALGVPEALPFLIEWSQDADPEVAVAATKAIQQIHLNPRR